jgi:hypothetical protein
VALYRAGEPAKLTPEEKAMAAGICNSHEVEDNYAGFIAKYYDIDLSRTEPESANRDWSATTADVVGQLIFYDIHGANATNVGLSLKTLGLTRVRQQVKGVQETRSATPG